MHWMIPTWSLGGWIAVGAAAVVGVIEVAAMARYERGGCGVAKRGMGRCPDETERGRSASPRSTGRAASRRADARRSAATGRSEA